MAQKTYTMDFVLNAVLNGGFSGVFSQAQQKFIQLGTEIKNLQSIQKDITAYQKQAQAVANTTTKLEHLQSQQAKVREQIEALKSVQSQDSDEKARNRAQVAALEREYLKYEQRIDSTKAALEKQQERLGATSDKLREAGVDVSALDGKSAELTERLKALEAEQKKLNEELARGGGAAEDFGEKGAAGVEAIATALAAAGVAQVLGEIKDGFMACVNAAGDFEYAMSAVAAISDANEQELAALNEKAKETGLTTIYTAQQSANAMEFMAMAGWEAEDMLAGMSGMVNLAAAAGEDLAEVSDIVTDNLTAFGMGADETAHFADVLAAAAANSNTNIHKMGESFKNSSAVAGALGYSVEDVAVALGLMANNAVKGTRAGTALRNIFNGFVEGMTLTGQSFGEVEVSAVNADGSIKGFMDTIRELRVYFEQMTGAEKIQNAMDIAGLRGYNGLLAIVNATDADFETLYKDINSCAGAAERMAKVKLDNMKGDLTIAKSAWEGLTIAVGEQFEPEMRTVYQLATDVFDFGSQFVKDNPVLLKTIAGTVTGLMGMATALTAIATAKKAASALELGTLFSGVGGIALAASAGVGALVGTVAGLADAANKAAPSVATLTEETRAAMEAIEEVEGTYEETATETMATADAAEHYMDRLEELEAQGKKSSEVNSEYQNTLALLLQTMPELAQYVDTTVDQYGRSTYSIQGNTDAIRDNIQAIRDQALAAASQEYLEGVYKAHADILLEASVTQIELQGFENEMDELQGREADLYAKLDKLDREAQAKYEANRANAPELTPEDYRTGAYFSTSAELDQVQSDMRLIQANIDNHTEALEEMAAAAETAKEEINKANKAVENLALNNLSLEGINSLSDALSKIYGEYDAYVKKYGESAETAQGFVDNRMEALSGDVLTYIENMDLSPEAAKAARETLQGYIDGVEDQEGPLAAAVQNAVNTAWAALQGRIDAKVQSTVNATATPTVINAQERAWMLSGAYAQGTSSAMRGAALVGEDGPEIVYMRGGETVIPADRTAAILAEGARGGLEEGTRDVLIAERAPGASSYTVNVYMQNGDAQAVAQAVREVLEDIEEDRRRRSYT